MAIRIIPDSLMLAIDYMKVHASVISLVGTRVSPELPPNPTYPYLTVTMMAGVEKDAGHLDEAYLDIFAWANTPNDASVLCRTARAVMLDAHLVSHARGVVSRPRTVMTPRWLPDDVNPPKPRWACTVAFSIHPHPL